MLIPAEGDAGSGPASTTPTREDCRRISRSSRQGGCIRDRLTSLVVSLSVLVGAAGCGIRFLPSVPWRSDYIVNRGEVYSVGDRCRADLTEVAVFTENPGPVNTEPTDLDAAVWHAVAEQGGVAEFVLLSSGQEGVRVVSDRSIGLSVSDAWVYVQDEGGKWMSRAARLTDLSAGMVASSAGLVSWDEYMAMPDADFGC